MSSAMDRALMEMSLEEKDEPFDMPDLSEYMSCERNKLSLIGRVLNPACQPMKHLIRNMPRKWEKEGRVKGVALTSERFQFIFDSKHDLEEVLEKGVQTFSEWAIVVDRWYEKPPDDYLRFMFIWVQIWNIPVNYYTEKAITSLGELIGEVREVVFNPDQSQIQEFVRVKVLFDVSRPLRKSKVVNLRNGETATVKFHYERIQKRCYECQRLTHEKDVCPILVKARQDQAAARRKGQVIPKPPPTPVLSESDPLFGVLKESQVGIDPNTGRPRIAQEVLEGMRQYLRVANEEEKLIRVDRVIQSVREAKKILSRKNRFFVSKLFQWSIMICLKRKELFLGMIMRFLRVVGTKTRWLFHQVSPHLRQLLETGLWKLSLRCLSLKRVISLHSLNLFQIVRRYIALVSLRLELSLGLL